MEDFVSFADCGIYHNNNQICILVAVAAATDDYLEGFCKQVLSRDYFIRFARIVDHIGHMIAAVSRQGLVPLMTLEESSRAAAQAAIHKLILLILNFLVVVIMMNGLLDDNVTP